MRLSSAEQLLQELGVTEPKEIDLEAISYYLNAVVKYRALDGCEARIVGSEDRAVITVNSRSGKRRRRFSIAHELGHWRYHKGQRLVCRAEEYKPSSAMSPERIADKYAADLILPLYLFKPIARQYGNLTIKVASEISDIFCTSLTATAIRLVEADFFPAFVICHGPNGMKWFVRAPMVPRKWFPQKTLDPQSCTFEIQFGKSDGSLRPSKIGADAWFDRREAERFDVCEQATRTAPQETVTLITITDERMLDDESDYSSRGW